MSNSLTTLSKVKALLATASTFDEVKGIRDKAETLRAYCKAAGDSLEIQNQCASLKLEAERRAGEMLSTLAMKPGPKEDGCTLQSIGIERTQSHRWQRLASIPEERFREYVDSTVSAGKELTSAGALRLAKDIANHERNGQVAAEPEGMVSTLEDLIGSDFATIYADPPWQYGNQATRAATDNHYGTMTIADIAALPVSEIAAPQSLLFLWTTNGFIREALNEIIPAWGFEYKSMIVWCKPQMGIGNYVRVSHELLLIANRGGLRPDGKSQKSWVVADRAKHSRKPHEFRQIVQKIAPAPRIELFAREEFAGWTCWGNEIQEGLFAG